MIKKFFKDWAKAFSVCYPMMVQGDLFALTLGHFWKANITGISAAFVALTISILYYDRDWEKFKWYNPLVLGFSTFMVDWMVHPTHFGGYFGEAALTGLGTFALAMFFAYKKDILGE